MSIERTRDFTTGLTRNGEPEILQLQDDGYRIWVVWLSGRPDSVAEGEQILWAEYKHCDLPHIGAAISDLLMTANLK